MTLQGAFVESNDGEECKLDINNNSLASALRLLGVTYEALNAAVTTVQFKAVDELVKKNLNATQAARAVQALIKGAYDSIFSLLVDRINTCIIGVSADESAAFIGLLDIFGFESFDKNSFEQLCINYCNESLQQQFNRFVFKLEQQEYNREGIKWDFVDFSDNQDILDLIEKKHGGILTTLDEQCMLGMRCNDRTFVSAVYDKCMKASSRFDANTKQKAQGKFSIHHYAGIVEYDTDGFMEKNKDEIPMEAGEMLSNSTVTFVSNIAQVMASKMSGSQKESKGRAFKSSISRVSVGGQVSSAFHCRSGVFVCTSHISRPITLYLRQQFSAQLQKLRKRIDETHPHYVRCLKPNDQLQPDRFEKAVVVDQLRCGGILEAIRVSRAGFPQRYTFEHFVSRFGILSTSLSEVKVPKVNRFRSASQGTPTVVKGLKKRVDPKRDCELLVKVIAKWILAEREKNTEEVDEPAPTDSLSPRSFWQTHQSPPKNYNSIHKTVDVSEAGIQMGATKVFLLQDTFDCIERVRGLALATSATKITAAVRRYLARVKYLAMLRAYRDSFRRRSSFEPKGEKKSTDSTSVRSVNIRIDCFELVANGRSVSAPKCEPQEFEWISIGHGRFIKRSMSDLPSTDVTPKACLRRFNSMTTCTPAIPSPSPFHQTNSPKATAVRRLNSIKSSTPVVLSPSPFRQTISPKATVARHLNSNPVSFRGGTSPFRQLQTAPPPSQFRQADSPKAQRFNASDWVEF